MSRGAVWSAAGLLLPVGSSNVFERFAGANRFGELSGNATSHCVGPPERPFDRTMEGSIAALLAGA